MGHWKLMLNSWTKEKSFMDHASVFEDFVPRTKLSVLTSIEERVTKLRIVFAIKHGKDQECLSIHLR